MITNITITFNNEDIIYSMQIPEVDNNIPYNLAEVFSELIKQTGANSNIVIEQLIYEFNYKEEKQL